MPIPRPAKDEKQNSFMGRCVRFMHTENDKKQDDAKWSNEQMVAICFSQWRKKGKAEIDTREEDERKSDAEFMERLLKKYPEYRIYFEDKIEE